MSDLDLEALKKTYGRVVHVRYNGHDIVFRKPNQGEAQLYRSSVVDTQEDRYEQMATMAQMILVYPALDAWHALLDDYPFMLSNESVNLGISRAMGVVEEKKDSTSPAQPRKPIPSASPSGSPNGSPSAPGAS
jgi:hypothetical protein